ncbi:MAG TPA: L-lactate permease [Micromonosporaceae bacterium]
MYKQVLDPVGNSLFLSAIVAAVPLLTLFILLGVLRMKAWIASLISLLVSLLVAILAYGMPTGQAVLSATEGAAFGIFPILWIVVNAIWIYNMTVETGHFDVLRRSFARISDDQRIQAILIAFSFGALLEALAGFGTPVAISSVMLIALGFRPLKAAAVSLVANTAPVAFGALAVPITTLSKVSNLPVHDLGSTVGRQTPILALFVPLALVGIVDGRRGVRQTWPAALLCGFAFAVAQFVTSNYISVPLTDIVASLFSAVVVVLFLRVWQPAETYAAGVPSVPVVAGGAVDEPTADFTRRVERGGDSRAEVAKAYAPYLIIIAVFVIAQIPAVLHALDSVTKTFAWPGLNVASSKGKPLSLVQFKFNWLSAAGTLLLISGLITMPVLRISPAKALRAYIDTLRQLQWAIITVAAVLALAFVMNASGQTTTLGTWMAGAGGAFAFLSPILGWLGVAVTGSDTSSNSLFGALQVTAADKAGLDATLMAASNSSGGVLGKMISPQNLAIAAAAVGLAGREGDIFRRVFLWSLLFLLGMCVLVYLQSTPVLSWMLP